METERFDLESIANRTLIEDVVHPYRDGLSKASNGAELIEHLTFWRPIAPGAYANGIALAEEDVKRFFESLRADRDGGEPMSEDAFLNIAIPLLLLSVAERALTFGVPFGAAFRRMVDLDVICVEDGMASLVESQEVILDETEGTNA